jgi:ATP-binding cassette subfamily B protein
VEDVGVPSAVARPVKAVIRSVWHRLPRPDPRRLQVLRLVWDTSKPMMLLLCVDVLMLSLLPNLVFIATGLLVGQIASAPATSRLTNAGVWPAFALVAIAFFGSMLATPFHQALAASIRVRLTFAMQRRLMRAVERPAGIAHLEDPALLDKLALAQGSLMSWFPADAPSSLARVWANRLACVVACAVVGWYVWWLGLALLILWPATRRPIMRVIEEHVQAFGGNADVMRRAQYLFQLSTQAAAAKEIRLFGLGAWLVDRFRGTWADGMDEVWRIRSGVHAVIGRIALLLLAFYVGAALVIAWQAQQGALGLQAVVIALPALAMTMILGGVSFDDLSLEWMLSALPNLVAVESDVEKHPSAVRGERPATGLPASEVRFEHVSFRYDGRDGDVLAAFDLTLPAGTSTAIVGANGAGKTTLVKLLARLHEPTEGQIVVDGLPLSQLSPVEWQRNLAVVFQDFIRYPLSARDNVGLGSPANAIDIASLEAAADRAGLGEIVLSLPLGWEAVLSPRFAHGVDLSGGEWQRVALARALFATHHGARLLVLDEPTASMDVRGEARFFEQFLDLTAGLTTVIISHRFSTVRLADQICVLDGGRITEAGSHDLLMEADGTYARLFRLQASRFADVAR